MRRPSRIALAIIAPILTVLAVGLPADDVLTPRLDPVRPADAVVVLGPVGTDGSLDRGLALAAARPGTPLALSIVPNQRGYLGHLCAGDLPEPDPQLICFVPDPLTTQGEARAIRDLARDRHWRHVTVVTPAYHVTRARILVQRCLSATTTADVTGTGVTPGPRRLLLELAYQEVALVKTWFGGTC